MHLTTRKNHSNKNTTKFDFRGFWARNFRGIFLVELEDREQGRGIFLVILWDFSGYFVGFFWLFCGIFLVELEDRVTSASK